MRFICGLGAGGKPGSRTDPWTRRVDGLAVQSAADGEEAERIAGARAFVNNAGVERHRNGVGFVVSGVVVFAIDHDEDRQQRGLVVFGNLEHSQGARADVFFPGSFSFARRDLGTFFLRRDGCDQKTCTGQGCDQVACAV
jgi:hypothetical protein